MEWRDIKGYEGLYEVCDLGMVRSVDRVATGNRKRKIFGKVIRPSINSTGYLVVSLCKDGKVKTKRVHRLVADSFLPNDKNKPYINHKDGNQTNNHISNLEWCTQKENVQHAYNTGLRKPNRILTDDQIEQIKLLHTRYHRRFGSSALARHFGVEQSVVWRAINGRKK